MSATLQKAPTQNYWSSSLNGAINNSVQTITLNSTTGLQAPGYIVIDREDGSGNATPNSREVVSYTGISGNDLTGCVRGDDNSTNRSHSDGALVEATLTIGMWNDFQDFVAVSLATVDGSLRPLSSASIATLNNTNILSSTATITTLTNTNLINSTATITNLIPSLIRAWDNWLDPNETWTYASASTFTIAGVDRTGVYEKGTKLRFKQGAGYKYATVASSSFSTNTTVTIIVNTDHTIANAAITDNYYSYAASPQGFPGFFTYTPSEVGFSSTSVLTGRYSTNGNWIMVQVAVAGTSDTTGLTLSLPVAAIAIGPNAYDGTCGFSQDNGAALTTPARAAIETDLTVITFNKDMAGAAWTGSGTKLTRATVQYRF